jgi:hypothetical protein
VLADRDRLAEQFREDRAPSASACSRSTPCSPQGRPEEAARFKDMLVLDVGEGVARARGRYGTEMSDDDANAVALAAQLLAVERYPVDEL